MVKGGLFAMEQLAEALAAVARSEKLPDGLPERAVQKCAEEVKFSGLQKCYFELKLLLLFV